MIIFVSVLFIVIEFKILSHFVLWSVCSMTHDHIKIITLHDKNIERGKEVRFKDQILLGSS